MKSHMHVPRTGVDIAPPARRRRVVIVDDHTFFAACLRMLLDNESDLIVCDVMSTAADLNERIARLRPDLLVIDLALGTENGLELGRRLRVEHGITTPILFTSSLARPSRAQLAPIGRCAFVGKTGRPEEFLAVLRHVLDGPSPAGVRPVPGLADVSVKAY